MINDRMTVEFIKCCFGVLFIVTGVLVWLNWKATGSSLTTTSGLKIKQVRSRYLIGYSFAVLADWLQGPYVYALYAAYGFDRHANSVLFVCGFGSSMLFGTIAGSLADKYGRKRFVLLYCLLYGFACITKHFSDFRVLLLGRLVGGISTSLLFSVFESWMIGEVKRVTIGGRASSVSKRQDLQSHQIQAIISSIFASQCLVNSIVAIGAGVLAQFASDALAPLREATWCSGLFYGGFSSPFDLAVLSLSVTAGYVSYSWFENYGIPAEYDAVGKNDKVSARGRQTATVPTASLTSTILDPSIAIYGLIFASFEASMYLFVFMWTPAFGLDEPLPFGLIFACFMVACMCGSQVFASASELLSKNQLLLICLALGSASHLVASLGISKQVTLIAFLVFEIVVGMYFPVAGIIKAHVVPENVRAGVYAVFRVPLNAIVVGSLFLDLDVHSTFKATSALMLCSACLLFSRL